MLPVTTGFLAQAHVDGAGFHAEIGIATMNWKVASCGPRAKSSSAVGARWETVPFMVSSVVGEMVDDADRSAERVKF